MGLVNTSGQMVMPTKTLKRQAYQVYTGNLYHHTPSNSPYFYNRKLSYYSLQYITQ